MEGATQKLSFVDGGILPIANSILSFSALFAEWRFPGHGDSYHDCGDWIPEGCLNVEGHLQNELFLDVRGKVFVRWHRRSCNRPDCPVCFEKWCAKEADKIDHRLRYTWTFGKIIHVAISPSSSDLATLSYPLLRARAYKIAQTRGVRGGVMIFHPWREEEEGSGKWEFRPHFHVIGYGWVKNTAELYRRDGWIVKNILDGQAKRSAFRTAQYQLSHCGLSDHARSITWFGVCSTTSKNPIKVPPMPGPKPEVCPCCGKPLVKLRYSGNQLELLESVGSKAAESGVWLGPEGWQQKVTHKFDGG